MLNSKMPSLLETSIFPVSLKKRKFFSIIEIRV